MPLPPTNTTYDSCPISILSRSGGSVPQAVTNKSTSGLLFTAYRCLQQPPPTRIHLDGLGFPRDSFHHLATLPPFDLESDRGLVHQQNQPRQPVGSPFRRLSLGDIDGQLLSFVLPFHVEHGIAGLSQRLAEIPVQVAPGGLCHDSLKVG